MSKKCTTRGIQMPLAQLQEKVGFKVNSRQKIDIQSNESSESSLSQKLILSSVNSDDFNLEMGKNKVSQGASVQIEEVKEEDEDESGSDLKTRKRNEEAKDIREDEDAFFEELDNDEIEEGITTGQMTHLGN